MTNPRHAASDARATVSALIGAAAALALAALAGAALAMAGVALITVGAPHDALAATPATAAQLLVHNVVVVLWPLALVALDWPRLALARRGGDALIAGQLLVHGALVGNALVQQPALWRYLPHLPAEWLAIAMPAGAWLQARTGRSLPIAGVGLVALRALVLLVAAALLETYLVPLP